MGDIYFGFSFSELHFSGYLFFSPKFLNWHQSVNLIHLLFFHVFMIPNDIIPLFTLKLVMYTVIFFSFVSVWIYKSYQSIKKTNLGFFIVIQCMLSFLFYTHFFYSNIFFLLFMHLFLVYFKVQGYSANFFLSIPLCLMCL